jgi:hypothetical protein
MRCTGCSALPPCQQEMLSWCGPVGRQRALTGLGSCQGWQAHHGCWWQRAIPRSHSHLIQVLRSLPLFTQQLPRPVTLWART